VFGRGLLLCIALLAASPASPASRDVIARQTEKRVALVIGNSAYPGAPLNNPVNDARAMTAVLRAQGFEVISRENTTKSQMEKSIVEFGQKLGEDTVGLVYYSGHGLQVAGKNYLIPVDAEISTERMVPLVTVDADNILTQMMDARNRVNLVILDACRNNPYERSFRALGGGLAQMNAPQGTMIAYATAPGKVASDGIGQNGLYTQELLKAMRQPGVKVEEVFKQVRVAVSSLSNQAQVPWEASSLTGDFYFSGAPNISGAQQATLPFQSYDPAIELAFWNSLKDLRNPDMFREYLQKYPKGQFAGLANLMLNEIENPTRPTQQVAALAPLPAVTSPASGTSRPPGTKFRDCADCPQMIVVPAGKFTMGSLSSQPGRSNNEGPTHQVAIAQPFAVALYDVTRDEYATFVRETNRSGGNCYVLTGSKFEQRADGDWRNPGFEQTGRDPASCVSWDDAKAYIQWLNVKVRRALQVAGGSGGAEGPYRLLTEAEWEYAARAGTTSAYYWGDAIGRGNANCVDCGSQWDKKSTSPAGSFAANSFGLYDMSGNVWQWTEDCYHDSYVGAPTDGSAWTPGNCSFHVLRGGSWRYDPMGLRTAARYRDTSDFRSGLYGFRLARTLN